MIVDKVFWVAMFVFADTMYVVKEYIAKASSIYDLLYRRDA